MFDAVLTRICNENALGINQRQGMINDDSEIVVALLKW